jgi:hypothetical protein
MDGQRRSEWTLRGGISFWKGDQLGSAARGWVRVWLQEAGHVVVTDQDRGLNMRLRGNRRLTFADWWVGNPLLWAARLGRSAY